MAQSLFGITDPALMQQAIQQEQEKMLMQRAMLSPAQRQSLYAMRAGQQAGGIVNSLFGNAPVADPRLQQAQLAQEAYQEALGLAGGDAASPQFFEAFAQTAAQRNLPQLAQQAAIQATKFKSEKQDTLFSKIDPKDYTAESVKAFAETGDYGSLVAKEKPTARYRTLSPAEARSRGLNPDNVYQLEEGTEKVTQIGQGPAVVFKAPLVGAENAYAKEVGDASAKRDISQFGAAEAAAENLIKINETLSQLQTGQAITGALADVQTNVQKLQAKFAADTKAGKRVTDTEYLDALLGSDVFPMIGALGIGARGLDTPAERDFLRQVMTGTIKLEKDTLVKLTTLRKNIAERAIDKFNDRVDKGELNNFFKYQGTAPRKFEKPQPVRPPQGPPLGIDSRVWNAMTAEEKALWK
jgi:hypothetical protein